MTDYIGAGASIIQGIGSIADMFGSGSNSSATNLQKKLLKYEQQMGTAGQVDARGNQIVYDKHSNTWRVIPGPGQADLLKASDAEALQQYQHDLPQQRAEMDQLRGMRGNERGIADTLSRRIIDRNPMTPEVLEALLASSGSRALNRQYDQERNDIGTMALRQKASPTSQFATLDQKQAESMAKVAEDAKLQALTQSDSINANRGNTAINQYNSMASQGKNMSGQPFNPASLGVDNLLSQNKQSAVTSGYTQGQTIDDLAKLGQQSYYGTLGGNVGNLLSGFSTLLGGSGSTSNTKTGLGNSYYGQPQAQRAGF